MEKLKFRIELLKNSDLIDEQIYNKIMSLVSHLDKQWNIRLTEENGAMFITHLSMALKRIKENQSVKSIDEGVFQEILQSDNIEEVQKIYEDIEKNIFNEKLPEEEKKFILVNLLLLKENK